MAQDDCGDGERQRRTDAEGDAPDGARHGGGHPGQPIFPISPEPERLPKIVAR
jgi:hypothetical protein